MRLPPFAANAPGSDPIERNSTPAKIAFPDRAFNVAIEAIDDYHRLGGKKPEMKQLRERAVAELARWSAPAKGRC